MKKLLFSLLAFGAVLLTGCQEEIGPVVEGGNVTFTLQTPDAVTKAESTIGNGQNVDIVYYEIYLDKPGHKNNVNGGTPLIKSSVPMSGKEATLSLNLLEDQDYVALFWAQVNRTENVYYNVEDLRKVSVNYTFKDENGETVNHLSNMEDRAAFYKKHTFNTSVSKTEHVTLVRPFAQLNLGTSKESLNIDYKIDLEKSQVVVTNVGTTFNVAEEKATADAQNVTFALNTVPADNPGGDLHVNDIAYEYAGMNYMLVPSDQATVDVTYDIQTNVGTVQRSVYDVPVMKNYRTNLIGNLLTQETKVEIVVDANFSDSENNYEGGKYGVLDGMTYVKVEGIDEFKAALEDDTYDMVILLNDLVLTESVTKSASADPTVTVKSEFVLDLNGHKMSAVSSQTGKNYNMFDVNGGTLTVKNGTSEYEHTGENMGWSNSTNLFNVTAGGVLNLEGVTARNLGGSDMAFVAHLNNWGEVTLNVDNCVLESVYIPVRVFNSGNHMNNVTIKNTTLKGKYCFWVHNYTVADFGSQDKADAHKALLNFDIFNGTNTFENTSKAPVLYGFTDSVYYDENGTELVFDGASLAKVLTSDQEDIFVALGNDIDVAITSLGSITPGSGEYKLGGENTKNITIDLNGNKLNVTTTYWSALGAKNEDALFTIKNGTMTSTGNSAGTWNAWDLRFSNCNYAFENVVFGKAVALDNVGKSTSMKNVTITDNRNGDTYGLWITAEGQTVTLEDCVIDMTPATDGRGIKIDNQYVAAAEQKMVTLNVKDVTLKTDEKAAILVKSVAGAEINVDGINITEVKEDKEFAVWVDEDAAAYADKVVVTGALMRVEGGSSARATTSDEVAAAIQGGASAIVLEKGEYVIPKEAKGKTVTFVGAGDPEDIKIAVTKVGNGGENCDYGLDGSTVTFENLTITTNSSNYIGYARCKGTYKNCIINGTYTLYGDSVFEDCTFNVSGNVYNIWTWGAPDATFNGCTFNSDGKALLLYGRANTNLTVNDCTFNDNGALTELKAAIEIGNDYNTSYELIVNDTVVNGYEINDKGINTGTTLWANKNSMPKDKLNVVVDGVDVY